MSGVPGNGGPPPGLQALMHALATGGQPMGQMAQLPSPVAAGLGGLPGGMAGAGVPGQQVPEGQMSPQMLAILQQLGLIPGAPAAPPTQSMG